MKIYINNFNLLTWPKRMAEILSNQGHEIIFIDNKSTYEPLLDFYNKCPYKIIRLNDNLGHNAGFISNIIDNKDYFVYTDPDLELDYLPIDWPDIFINGINKYNVDKCGVSLNFSKIPSQNPYWIVNQSYNYPDGKNHWCVSNKLDNLYIDYPIDTVFAVYKQGTKEHNIGGITTTYPYGVRHLPYHIVSKICPYEDSKQIEMDFEYYNYIITSSSSSSAKNIFKNLVNIYEHLNGGIKLWERF